MDPEEISKKADQQRLSLQKTETPAPKQKKHKTYNAFSFRVYSKIFPGKFNFILWMLLTVPGAVFVIIYFTIEESGIWALYTGIGCVGIFLIRWIVDFFQRVFTFSTYKNFPATLGFQLNGWDTLGSFPKQLKSREWSKNSTIEVVLKNTATDTHLKLAKDALYLFVSRANEHFYEADIGCDGRTTWTSIKMLKVVGSSDTSVIGEMYTLIHVYLKSIQDKYNIISSLNVKFDAAIFTVEPPRNID